MFRQSNPDQVRTTGRLSRLLLCVWLTVWLLHIPVPVIHQHDGERPSLHESRQLSLHLERFHGSDSHREWFPWHIHWVQTSDLADGDCPDGESDDQHDANASIVVQGQLALSIANSLANSSAFNCGSTPAHCSSSVTEMRCVAMFLRRQFLQTYSAALPMRALLGRALC